ncbi:medium-chain fatty acid-CoA ligase faa2 [Coemansia sp. RSA 552]|nr:medium-chain fatty acid-CoA ligase faa2 [Coemansia sp. RSA 552]
MDFALVAVAGLALVAGAVYFYYFSPHATQPDIHPLQLAQQASASALRESPSESAVYRSKAAPPAIGLHASPSSDILTLRDAIRAGRRTQSSSAMHFVAEGRRHTVSADDAASHASAFAASLLRLLDAGSGDGAEGTRAAVLFLPGSAELLTAYLACVEAGVPAIPVAAAVPATNAAAIVAHSKTRVLVTSATLAAQVSPLLSAAPLTHVVIVADGSEDVAAWGTAAVVSFAELQQGAPLERDAAIEPSDTAYVLYTTSDAGQTSGTIVTHQNALAAVTGLVSSIPPTQSLGSSDLFMCAAPMAAPANISLVNLALTHGCAIGFADTADAEVFVAHSELIRPTFTYIDPLLARDLVHLFYSHVDKYPRLERWVFDAGYRHAVDSLMRCVLPKANIWDFLYFRHYRHALGGKLRLMYVDGRSTSSKSIEWLRVIHGAKVVPAFGTAATSGVMSAGLLFDYATAIETHNVGVPLACNEIKVVDADSVNLSAGDAPNPRGSILVRGPNVAPAQWNSSLSAELNGGWLKLPFYGEILPNDTIEIIGDQASVVKSPLSPSGYIFVEQLERALASSMAVAGLCVVATQNAKSLAIVAYPRPMELYDAANRLNKEYDLAGIGSYTWCADYIRHKLVDVARDAGYQWLADMPAADIHVKLVSEPFSLTNGLAHVDGSNNRAAAMRILGSN